MSAPPIVIVGAGPAGLAAASSVAAAKRRALLIDDAPRAGGQIWRHDIANAQASRAADWLGRARDSLITAMSDTRVIAAESANGIHHLTLERSGRAEVVETDRVILATGARELFLPFPGWTLPGVVGVGGAQALAKGGMDVRGKRIVVAGSGPLLIAVAASLAKRGARVVLVAEQAPRARMIAFGLRTLAAPRIARDAVSYLRHLSPTAIKHGTWITAAHGDDRVREVTVSDGHRTRTVGCDLACIGFGLVPNSELARVLGCESSASGVRVDADQQTTVPGVYAAGECAGIAGVDAALAEGAIAGCASAGVPVIASLRGARAKARAWGDRLAVTFALRDEVLALGVPDTIICRCEDVRLGDLQPDWSIRQAKLYARVGMGACQGRVCGAALDAIRGWGTDRARTPLSPSFLSSLAARPPE